MTVRLSWAPEIKLISHSFFGGDGRICEIKDKVTASWIKYISEYSLSRWPRNPVLKNALDTNFTNEKAKFHKGVP